MTTPHKPGVFSRGEWQRDSYNDYRWELWQTLEDAYYASVSGFGHCRMPAPGQKLDRKRFDAWRERTVERWETEAHRQLGTRGLVLADWPEELWLYVYQRMLAAEPLKPPPPPPQDYVYDDD